MKFSQHKEIWKDCEKCYLCQNRNRVVLGRGSLPCDILFIGEAPGNAEDTFGSPFKGPAGQLLDEMLAEAQESEKLATSLPLKLAFTNLVACIPFHEKDRSRTREPEPDEIKACKDRLNQFLEISKPKRLVFVGKLPQKWVPKLGLLYLKEHVLPKHNIVHPAFLLRMDQGLQGLKIQETTLNLRDILEESLDGD